MPSKCCEVCVPPEASIPSSYGIASDVIASGRLLGQLLALSYGLSPAPPVLALLWPHTAADQLFLVAGRSPSSPAADTIVVIHHPSRHISDCPQWSDLAGQLLLIHTSGTCFDQAFLSLIAFNKHQAYLNDYGLFHKLLVSTINYMFS